MDQQTVSIIIDVCGWALIMGGFVFVICVFADIAARNKGGEE